MNNTSNTLLPRGFKFEDSDIRVITREGEPWFVLVDVCRVLDITKHRDAAARLDADERGSVIVDTLGGPQETVTINESGLYSLILTSRKEAAKRFKKWVTSEVLPAIRKTGSYGVAPAPKPIDLTDAATVRALLLNFTETNLALQAKVSAQAPKVAALDLIATRTDGTLCITDAAKALQMRPTDLFDWLKAQRWIYRRVGGKNWLGYQDKTQFGYLEHKVKTITVGGEDKVTEQVLVTAKGLARLAEIHGATLALTPA